MTLDRGSRDDTTARPPVSTRFLLSLPPPSSPASLPLVRDRCPSRVLSLCLFFSPFLSIFLRCPLLLLPSSERRQVGIRAAVNSPAPLSALMSLLLFALLNAIRAYSVSLSPPGPRQPSPRLPPSTSCSTSRRLLVFARWWVPGTHTYSAERNPRGVPTVLASVCWWMERTCVAGSFRRDTGVYRDADGRIAARRRRGIAISRRHAAAHYCVISRTKTRAVILFIIFGGSRNKGDPGERRGAVSDIADRAKFPPPLPSLVSPPFSFHPCSTGYEIPLKLPISCGIR